MFRPFTSLSSRLSQVSTCGLLQRIPCRSFFRWVDEVANRPDLERRKEVGPERSCAEWLLRCGALVKWEGADYWHRDYNTLPVVAKRGLMRIAEVDVNEAGLMQNGFCHFDNCKYIKKIRFTHCPYLDDDCVIQLKLLKGSLEHLVMISCGDVTDRGLRSLAELSKLKTLHMRELPAVRQKQECYDHLRSSLPECDINYEDLHGKREESGGG